MFDRGRRARAGRRGARAAASIEPLTLTRQGGAGADQRHRRDARHARARAARPRAAAEGRRRHRGDVASRRCSAPTAPSPPTWSRCARSPGQAASAANMPALLAGSPIVASHRHDDPRVQDAYSLRCAPQVNGAARDTLDPRRGRGGRRARARRSTTRWCCPTGGSSRAATSTARRVAHGVRLPRDRRRRGRRDRRAPHRPAARPARSHGLPPFLAEDAGVNSGLMIAQYTQAAMVAENRRLAVAGERRLAAHERHAGGPRVDGLGRARASCARSLREPRAHPRRRADLRGARRSTCARRSSPAPGTAAALDALRDAVSGPGRRTAAWRPSWPPPSELVAVGRGGRGRRGGDRGARMSGRTRGARAAAARSSPARAGRRRPRCGC